MSEEKLDLVNNGKLTVEDEEGNEHLINVLFTYENEERKTSYVFFYEDDDEENVMVMRYLEDGSLEVIEDDDEYDEVEEVFNAWEEDPEIQKLKESK